MRRILLIAFSILLTTISSKGQILKGKISDTSGNPIQYSTVYIQELKQGTTATARGDYEIRLPAGSYNVFYQSLGFSFETKKVTIPVQGTVILNVILQPQYYQLPEIRVSATGEDPAYVIMRRAIGFAPYYLSQVKSYLADVYLKGNLEVLKIPKLLQKSLKIDANNTTIKTGDSFMMESVNEITFTAPDKYIQRIISFNSTFPSEGDQISPMDFIQASFYEPVIADMAISPLSPEAFSHYNFKYQGATIQGEYLVDKITVTPKRKSQQLFSGTIFIIEDLWCLQSVDLINENIAGKVRIRQIYVPVQDEIWLPVSHNFEINLEVMGLRADIGYGSSVKYKSVELNTSIPKPSGLITVAKSVTPQKTDTLKSKTSEELNNLLKKEDLTNRDMVKISKLMEKEATPDKKNEELEIKDNTTRIIEKDARQKDSTYWADIRPIPLSESDIRSLSVAKPVTSDSLSTNRRRGNSISLSIGGDRNNSAETSQGDTLPQPKKEKSAFMKSVTNITAGHTWSDTTGFSFRFGGLLKLSSLSFNTVDGFSYGTDFRISKSWKNNNNFSVYPEIKWAFSRKSLMWVVNSTFNYDRIKQKQIYLRAGMTSTDFNNNGGINPFINSLTSLFLQKNYMKLYENRYVRIGHSQELINGFYLGLNANFEKRTILSNTTDFSFIKTSKVYSANIPLNGSIPDPVNLRYFPQDNLHLGLSAVFTYTPRQRYRMRDGRKIPSGSDSPTFSLVLQHGINKFTGDSINDSNLHHFDRIIIEANNRREIGAFSEYNWILRTGGFFNKKGVTFQDFRHFNSQPFPVLLNNYQDPFMLTRFYELSTPNFYIEGHFKYTNPYLLLKLLPGISNTLMRENLSFSYLYTNHTGSYTELGYSVSEILLIGEIGLYSGFRNVTYNSTGVKLILRFN